MLDDLLGELLCGLRPELSEGPGSLLLTSLIGTISIRVHFWLSAAVGNPITGPPWAWGTFTTIVIFGIAGVVLGFAGVRRGEYRAIAWTSVVINAVNLALAWALAR